MFICDTHPYDNHWSLCMFAQKYYEIKMLLMIIKFIKEISTCVFSKKAADTYASYVI